MPKPLIIHRYITFSQLNKQKKKWICLGISNEEMKIPWQLKEKACEEGEENGTETIGMIKRTKQSHQMSTKCQSTASYSQV